MERGKVGIRVIPYLIILIAWALRLYRLDVQSFWYDEGYAVYIAGLGPADTILWSSRDFIPPLHSLLLALWLPLAGGSEFAARFLSLWMGILAVAGTISLGSALYSPQAGSLAGILATLSPFYVWYSQEARIYMCQLAFGSLATLCLVRALKRPTVQRLWLGMGLLNALALYTQTTTAFLLVFHSLVVLVTALFSPRQRRVVFTSGGLSIALAVLLWLPWLIYAWRFLGANAGYWPGLLDWRSVLWGAFQAFVTGQVVSGPVRTIVLIVWGIAFGGALLCLLVLPTAGTHQAALFLAAHFLLPVTAMALVFRSVPKFSPRYLILASPPLFLSPALALAAIARHTRWPRAIGALLLSALVTSNLPGLLNLYFNPAFARSDFRAAARLVREHQLPGETVLIVPGHTFPVWQYYFGATGWLALPNDPILDVRHVLHYRNAVAQLNAWLQGRSGVWLVEWEPWVVDPTDIVVHILEQAGEKIPLPQQPAGLRVYHYRFTTGWRNLPEQPAVSSPQASSLELPLKLTGCALPASLRGDEELRLDCFWEAWEALPHHLSVSLRLLDQAGEEWARADTAISGAYLVAGRWPLGEPVLGRYSLRPVPGTPPGSFYRLDLLVYEPAGRNYGTVTVGPLVIERPSRPFEITVPAGSVASGSLGGLIIEGATLRPENALPGSEVRLEALWQVGGPFSEPHLELEGTDTKVALLPLPGATRLWQPGDRYRTITHIPVSPYAMGGPTTLLAVSDDGILPLAQLHIDITRTFTMPSHIPPLDYRLGEDIALCGAQVTIIPGQTIETMLYWQALDFIDRPHTVFVQLLGPNGHLYAQADSWPQAGRHPTHHWLPGEIVADPYRLELPPDAPAGMYSIIAGMYDYDVATGTAQRLPVVDAAGRRLPDDAIVLTRCVLGAR